MLSPCCSRVEWKDVLSEYIDDLTVGRVSVDGLGSLSSGRARSFPFLDFRPLSPLNVLYMVTTARVLAFLVLRQSDTLSSDELTLFHSISRYTGELLSSLSSVVLRQSSMASLMAVRVTMTISGTEPNPGSDPPKMEKICQTSA